MSGAGGAGGGGRGGAVNPWLVNESEETRGLSFGEIKQQQHSIMEGKSGPAPPHRRDTVGISPLRLLLLSVCFGRVLLRWGNQTAQRPSPRSQWGYWGCRWVMVNLNLW